jgi:transposase
MRDNDWTRVLSWPGYKVYRHEIDEVGKRLKLWVRRKRTNKLLICSGCGKSRGEIVASYEREVRDLPCFEYLTTVVVELYRVGCPDCGVKAEKVPLLPSKAPFSQRFEDAVGHACESAATSRVARQFGLAANTVRAGPAADGCGRDLYGQEAEVHHRGERPRDRPARELVKGKRWLLLTRWVHLTAHKKQQPNQLFALNRGVMRAYLLKESLDRLWTYRYEGAMLHYLKGWIDQLRWQRLKPMEKMADILLRHLEGILNYCRTKVPLGVVEAVNGNIKATLRRGRGYRNLSYLLLKAQRLAATRTQLVAFQKAA